MSTYYFCNVVDNVIITAPRPLPTDVSIDSSIDAGWYPVVFLNMPHQIEHDQITEIIVMKTRIENQQVICWHETAEKPAEEIEQTQIFFLQNIRNQRDMKLLTSDWTQLPNAPITEEKKQEWETYRQQLREFPDVVDLSNIIWPVPPLK